jgi:hypothetical protein
MCVTRVTDDMDELRTEIGDRSTEYISGDCDFDSFKSKPGAEMYGDRRSEIGDNSVSGMFGGVTVSPS